MKTQTKEETELDIGRRIRSTILRYLQDQKDSEIPVLAEEISAEEDIGYWIVESVLYSLNSEGVVAFIQPGFWKFVEQGTVKSCYTAQKKKQK